MTDIPFVDLFCGAGGLSAGFEQAGFQSVFANDYDKHASATYALNHPHAVVSSQDVVNLSGEQITNDTSSTALPLIIGGPNCQGVSLRGKRDPNDPKNRMFYHFLRLIEELQPTWFVMENVPGLLHRHNRELLTDIFAVFDNIGYKCGGEILLAADYGVPQLRYRFVLIGTRTQLPVLFPNATHRCPDNLDGPQSLFELDADRSNWLTVRDAIGDLPPLENGGGDEKRKYPRTARSRLSDYQLYCRQGSDALYNHVCHRSPNTNIELIKHIPPGKNWKSIPERLRPARFSRVALKDHTTTFGRLRWDFPARTITTYFNNISAGAFTHPDQHRGISVREGARLQGFVDQFQFTGPLAHQYRQVGNAVPPIMARHVATVIHSMMTVGHSANFNVHGPTVEYDRQLKVLRINRALQGMRFNLDKHLVRS